MLSIHLRLRPRLRGVLCAALSAPVLAHAGLDLEEAIERHRADRSGAPLTASTPALTAPDAITVAAFGSREPLPPFVRPAVDGAGGVKLRYGRSDADGLSWRIGLGWADRVNYQGDRFQGGFDFEGSELSHAFGGGQVYASVQRRHWGPSWVGSMILDEGAPALPAIGWRKTAVTAPESRWLAWLGPWNADVFVGTLAGHSQPARPRLWAARFQFAPLPGLEIGLSRAIEWGGQGREESFATLWDAVVGHDNVDGNEYNPSNQLGGFDARYSMRFGEHTSFSIYGQAVGEDEAGGLPSQYLGSAGVDFAFVADGASGRTSLRVFAERANTVAGGIAGHERPGVAYEHSTYRQGYTQQGVPLGFPAGGDVTLNTLGLLIDRAPYSALLMLHAGRAHEGTQLYSRPGRLGGGDAQLAWHVTLSDRIGATLSHWRDPDSNRTRAQLWWQHLLD